MIDIDTLLLRDRIALPTIMHIEVDSKRCSDRLRPLLKTIQKRLFDADFNVNALWRENDIHDKTAAARFHELDTTPNAYITAKRLEVAEKLVASSRLPIRRISGLVGYANETTFGRAFRRRFELPPDVYRRKVKSGEILCCFDEKVAKGMRGELQPKEGQALLLELRVIGHQLKMQGYGELAEEGTDEKRTERPETDGGRVH